MKHHMCLLRDDAAPFAEDENSLQRISTNLPTLLKNQDLYYQLRRLKHLRFVKVCCKLQLRDRIIELVSSFSYLSIQTTSHPHPQAEVNLQATEVPRISSCLNGASTSNQFLKTEAKVRQIFTYRLLKQDLIQQNNKHLKRSR